MLKESTMGDNIKNAYFGIQIVLDIENMIQELDYRLSK